MRVLVVEDEKKTASFVRKALQGEGFAVDVCHRGDDALAALRGNVRSAEETAAEVSKSICSEPDITVENSFRVAPLRALAMCRQHSE